MSNDLVKNLIVVFLLLFVAILFYFFIIKPTTEERQKRERQNTAVYNLRLLGEAIQGYSEKNNGHLPIAKRWCDLLLEYDKTLSKDTFEHPRIAGVVIAFNENLDGMRLSDVDKSTVLLFETKGGWNMAGGEELIKKANPNRKTVDLLFTNGKIKTCWVAFVEGKISYEDTVESLRWKP